MILRCYLLDVFLVIDSPALIWRKLDWYELQCACGAFPTAVVAWFDLL